MKSEKWGQLSVGADRFETVIESVEGFVHTVRDSKFALQSEKRTLFLSQNSSYLRHR